MPSPILPTVPAPAEYISKTKTTSFRSEALSSKILTRQIGGQRFEFTLKYPPMTKNEFASVETFLTCRSRNDIFYVEVPQATDAAGQVVGNYVNFHNDSKLHKVSAIGPTVVYPPMRNAGGIVVSSLVYLRCSRKGDIQSTKLSDDGFIRFEVDLEERI